MTGIPAGLSFLRPELLWLVALPLLLLFRRAPAVRVLEAPMAWAGTSMESPAGRVSWYGRRWLCAGAAVLLLAAAAGPVRRQPLPAAPSAGAAVMVVLDVSPSMRGGAPAPLELARTGLASLLRRRRDVRLGLVTFAGSALTRLPPTSDTGLLERVLATAVAGVRDDGTALGTAVGLAVERLSAVEARERIVVVLSDGMHNAGAVDPVTAAELARADGTRVHAVLLAGAPPAGRALLEDVARAGGGAVFASPADADSLLARLESLAPLPGSAPAWRTVPAWAPPIRTALVLLAAALAIYLLRPARRGWPPAGSGAAAAVVLAGLALALSGAPEVPVPEDGTPAPVPPAGRLRIAVDVSRSMAVGGARESRLDRGRAAVRQLLARAPGAEVELAVFGGRAHTLLPPTRDLAVVLRYLDALEPGLLSRTGTGREALLEWLSTGPPPGEAGGYAEALVVTDGEWFTDGSPYPAGLPRTHVVWTGQPARGPVPGADAGVSTARRAGPALLARATDGRVVPAEDGGALAALARALETAPAPPGRRSGGEGDPEDPSGPRPPLAAALSGLLLSLILWNRGGRP